MMQPILYVNCSNINRQLQHGTTLLPPRQLCINDDKFDAVFIPPPRNIPRPGCLISCSIVYVYYIYSHTSYSYQLYLYLALYIISICTYYVANNY